MPFDAKKYLGNIPKKKRSFKEKMRLKLYAYKKQTSRKYKDWKIQCVKEIGTKKEWKDLLFLIPPYFLFCLLLYLLKFHREFTIGILLLILQFVGSIVGIIVGIIVAFFISKVIICFLYEQSVNIISKFIVDILDEVDKKREKRRID